MGKMESKVGDRKGSRGHYREAILVFAATAVVVVVVIASLQFIAAESNKEPYPLRSGDWIRYDFEGTISNETTGGDLMFYFTETMFGDLRERIITLTPSGMTKSIVPFYTKDLLSSQIFLYDGRSLYVIGDLLATSISEYDGTNATDLTMGWFGEFVGYENVGRGNDIIMPYGNGEAAHYINTHNGTTLEQWVANGTGLPIKLRFADGNGTDITLTISYTAIEWIEKLPR